MNTEFGVRIIFTMVTVFFFSACVPMLGLAPVDSAGSSGLQVYPNSTTVGISQDMTFQVSGGNAPYQYQMSGDGTIDSYGNYQAGPYPGQAQIQVSDSYGNSGSAMVSVVQSSATYDSYAQPKSLAQVNKQPGQGWSAVTRNEFEQSPLVRGQIVGVGDHRLDALGDSVHSKFLKTNLKHPVVRVDELIEEKRMVAVRAVVEDQFLVKLRSGHSEADLSTILAETGARISKRMDTADAYLVSMNKQGELNGAGLSANFITSRARLKQELQTIGVVSPNFLSRAPSAESGPR